MTRVRVALPAHLRRLARVQGDTTLELGDSPTVADMLDALERDHPMLRGTIRDHQTGARRPMLRFFADGEDLSHDPPSRPLPEAVTSRGELFQIVGAIAGG